MAYNNEPAILPLKDLSIFFCGILPQFKPTKYSFRKTLQNGSILFGSYVMTQNTDTGNFKISKQKSLVE